MKSPKLALLAVVGVFCLILAACGDDDGESTTTQAPPVTQTRAATQGGPAIPADHEGRAQCLVCHADGGGGAPEVPAAPDHSTLTDDRAVCAACHPGG